MPSNDDFANRTTIASLPFTDSQDTTEATNEADEPRPRCVSMGNSVWYEYTPANDAALQADTLGSDFDTGLAIWTGDNLSNLTEIACSDDTGSGLESMAVFLASAGSTYFIQAGGFGGGEGGALSLHVGPATSGSISGTVNSDTGEPLPNICVEANSEEGWGGWARTSGLGTYTIGGLEDGTYRLHFYDRCDNQRSHVEEWFDDQPSEATATAVSVTSPEAVTGIDAQLTSMALGSISGTVTSDTGGPLPRICLDFYDAAMTEYWGWTETESDGTYSFGLPEGTYNIYFFDGCDDRRDHDAEWFDDQPSWTTATAIPVTALQATTGIDAELTALGSISGTVTSDTGEPLAEICVDVRDAATGDWEGYSETSSLGTYSAAVPEGTYHVGFYDCYGQEHHAAEWFDDQPTEATATDVVVTGSNTTLGIDAELTTLVLGSISGTVTSHTGAPLNNICVDVRDATTGDWEGWAETSPDGTYTIELAEGAYHVNFSDWCDAQMNHQEEWFDDQPTQATANQVVVTGNNTTTGIDAELAPYSSAPQTTITSGPSGTTTSATATFGFTSSQQGSVFQCSLDGSNFAPCTSPTTYSDLVEGSHTFRVRAVNGTELDASPAQRSWVVDTNPPVLAFQRPTAGPYVNDQPAGGAGPIVVAGYVTVEATAVDPQSGVSLFTFEVDGVPVAPSQVTQEGNRYLFTYRPASPGNHTITARATNGSGLTSTASIQVTGVPTP
ncbi:MAG: hypothetical protein ACRDH9_09205 [Actinomycetota bacterium]